ncbi:hypothetical protein M5689_010992 [Euphorbia peplus]|nr:hypothetical protein M5689_010992 [Euphorbia peplus]
MSDGGYATPNEVLGGDGVDYGPSFRTDEKFETRDEAVENVKSIDIIQHLEMVISSNHKDERRCTMRCSRGTRYKPLKDPSTRQRQRRTNKFGCPVKLKLKLRRYPNDDFWCIHTCALEESMHNHPLAVYPEGYKKHVLTIMLIFNMYTRERGIAATSKGRQGCSFTVVLPC